MKKEDVVLLDSIAHSAPEHRDRIIVGGSHGGLNVGKVLLNRVHPKFAVLNDAGMGKNDAALLGVKLLGENGIAAASADCMTAMIGNADDTYENGVLSFVNSAAEKMGIKVGMTVKEACDIADRA